MKTLHFHTSLTEKIGILLDNNKCKDIAVERQTQTAQLNSIYIGRVRNVDSSVEAAFVDLGKDNAGFLPKSEIPFIPKDESLSSGLTEGARIVVQVIKEAYQDKGPRLTANITLNGFYIVYLPHGNYIACSKKIPDPVKKEWKSLLENIKTGDEGLILRTNGAEASEKVVIQELEELRKKWQQLLEKNKNIGGSALILDFPLIPDQIINQYQSYPIDAITFDEKAMLKKTQAAFPHLADKMRVRKHGNKIENRTVTQWLEDALKPTVKKEDGITLTIEETEALTVIDIDSSRFHSHQNKRDTVFHINRRAVGHCVEEIRKRNISGIILIDFLKMKKKEEYIIVSEMKKKCKEDPVRTEIYGFTKLGLMELTRKRERVSLSHLMTTRSRSFNRSVEAISFQLERELTEWNQSEIEALIVRCPSAILHFINDYLREELLKKLRYRLYLQLDNQQEGYSIIRAGSMEQIDLYRHEHPEITIDSLQ